MNPVEFKAKLKASFSDEANELILVLDKKLVLLETQLKEKEDMSHTLDDIFRCFHTLKASLASMSFIKTSKALHDLESVLDKLRQELSLIKIDLIQDIFTAFDFLKVDIGFVIQNDQDSDCKEAKEVIAKIIKQLNIKIDVPAFLDKSHRGNNSSENQQSIKHYQIIFRPFSSLLRNGFDPIILFYDLEDLGNIFSVNCSWESIPEINELVIDELYITWEIILETKKSIADIKDAFMFVAASSDLTIEDISNRFTPEGLKNTLADKKIGEILVERNLVSEKSIEHELNKHKKLGEILVESNQVAAKDLEKAVSDQEQARKNASTSIRVDVTKMDSLLDLVGELVIAELRLKNSTLEIAEKEVRRNIIMRCDEVRRLIADLQGRVMNIRMVAADSLFSQFQRVVRDLSHSQQKVIRLVLVGQETEIDKNIIEKINSPLKHLVRNSVDHGIEKPEEREKANKNKEALITLKAYQKEGSVFIEIIDDGRGLNVDSIRSKAIEKGLIGKDDHLTNNEYFNLIFLPGFSTAAVITDVSGRGVGMDVVKKSVEELSGLITLHSEFGKGTRIVIRLPLTLAIIEGLLFKVADRKFAIPLMAVDKAVRPLKSEIKTLEGKGEYVDMNGVPVSLVRLHKLFKIPNSEVDPSKALLLNVKVHGRQYAIMVDDVIGQQQVVLKSLEKNYEKVLGFSGATILGDGTVASIIDPDDLVTVYKRNIL